MTHYLLYSARVNRQRHLQKMLAILEEGVGSIPLACTMLKAILTMQPNKEEEFKARNISCNLKSTSIECTSK